MILYIGIYHSWANYSFILYSENKSKGLHDINVECNSWHYCRVALTATTFSVSYDHHFFIITTHPHTITTTTFIINLVSSTAITTNTTITTITTVTTTNTFTTPTVTTSTTSAILATNSTTSSNTPPPSSPPVASIANIPMKFGRNYWRDDGISGTKSQWQPAMSVGQRVSSSQRCQWNKETLATSGVTETKSQWQPAMSVEQKVSGSQQYQGNKCSDRLHVELKYRFGKVKKQYVGKWRILGRFTRIVISSEMRTFCDITFKVPCSFL